MYSAVDKLAQQRELTEGEAKALNAIMESLSLWEPDGEPGYSDLDARDVAEKMRESIVVVRGYIGSLVKKGFIYVDQYLLDTGFQSIIYITDKTRKLY